METPAAEGNDITSRHLDSLGKPPSDPSFWHLRIKQLNVPFVKKVISYIEIPWKHKLMNAGFTSRQRTKRATKREKSSNPSAAAATTINTTANTSTGPITNTRESAQEGAYTS